MPLLVVKFLMIRIIVNRVVKTPDGYNGFTIKDLYFSRGRMEDEG